MDQLRKCLKESNNVKIKTYYITLIVAWFSTLLSMVADYLQGFSARVLILLAVGMVIMLLLMIFSLKYHIENIGSHILVYLFNVVLFPELFLQSGGVSSGMVLIFIVSLAVTAVLLEGKFRVIAYLISIVMMEYTIIYSYRAQDKITLLSYKDSVVDYVITLLVVSVTVVCIMAAILRAYDEEKEKTDELNKRLTELSVKDELSGLYNRRELFRRLDVIYDCAVGSKVPSSRQDCYIAMFDIDNFKSINDTYGHQFGDEVLSTIAHVLMKHAPEKEGELAARYGGEEFVNIIRAKDQEHALERVEEIRKEIEDLKWEEVPDLTVTISGGLASCEKYEELRMAMHDVDALLYKAKHEGKNRIQA